ADHCQIGFPKGCGEIPAGALEVHRRAIPLGETTSLVKGNVCLVGDAGGLVNPITFGGIRIAFESGRMAAQAVAGGDIASYEGRWKASRYADQKFYEGYRQLRSMDNAQLQGSMEPFRNGYGPLLYAKAMMGRSEYRGLYRAYASSMRFGW
ncbi:MAG TPA: hypothetical protein VLH13_04805, partial [Methanomassiliicoccales archaeon]|nr:hypothetical protein [Methanomassiliicoccales archaeon]